MTEEEKKLVMDRMERSRNSRESEVRLVGDRNVLIQVIMLLAYVRDAIRRNEPSEIKVEIGKSIQNGEFDFLLDNERVDDVRMAESIQIN